MRKHDLAIEDMTEAIRIKPQQADLYYGRGGIFAAAGQRIAP